MKLNGPVLLVGGGGTVGWGLGRAISKEMGRKIVVVGEREGKEKSWVELDILDRRGLEKAIRKIKPGLIVHLAAATDVNRCEREPDWAEALNVVGTRNVVKAARQIPVIYLSTDFVFSGRTDRLRKEMDNPDPVSVYGRTKRGGELELLRSANPGGVMRISFPWYPRRDHEVNVQLKDALWWMGQSLLEGKEVPAFGDIVGGWTSMEWLEKIFLKIVGRMLEDKERIVHVAGEFVSPYAVALVVRDRLVEEGRRVTGEVVKTEFEARAGEVADRPRRGGLDVGKLKKWGWSQPAVIGMIRTGRW